MPDVPLITVALVPAIVPASDQPFGFAPGVELSKSSVRRSPVLAPKADATGAAESAAARSSGRKSLCAVERFISQDAG